MSVISQSLDTKIWWKKTIMNSWIQINFPNSANTQPNENKFPHWFFSFGFFGFFLFKIKKNIHKTEFSTKERKSKIFVQANKRRRRKFRIVMVENLCANREWKIQMNQRTLHGKLNEKILCRGKTKIFLIFLVQ